MAQTPSNAIQQRSLTSLGGMDEVQKVFNKFDTNGDGKISVSELRSVFKALGVDVGTSSGDLTNAVTEIDKDGDGEIGLEEFADFHRAAARGDGSGGESINGKAIGDAFEMYDRDSNGLISAQELHEVMKGLGEGCSVLGAGLREDDRVGRRGRGWVRGFRGVQEDDEALRFLGLRNGVPYCATV